MIIYGLTVLLLILAVDYSLRFTRFGRLLHKIPSPFPLPIIGHALKLASNDREYLWYCIGELGYKYYPIFQWWYPGYRMIVSLDPDDCKILLTGKESDTKAYAYTYLKPWLSDSIFVSSGDLWHLKRKMFTPVFHPYNLRKYIEVTQEQGELFLKKLSAESNGIVQDLLPLMSKLTFYVVCASMMGCDPSTMEKDAEACIHAIEDCVEISTYRYCRPYISDWMFNFLSVKKKQNSSVATTRAFATKLIKERKKELKIQFQSSNENISNVNDMEDTNGEIRKATKLIDLLIEAESKGIMNEQDIIGEIITFFLGGYDTTALTLTYMLCLFAEDKEIQNEARSEALDVMNRCQGKITINDIQSLDYIDRCIKETLRLYPSGPYLLRKITKDMQLKNYLIPAGVEFAAAIFYIHRDPKYWPNPEKFDPDRWLPENSKNRHPYAYLPFSAGPRNCLGQKFGMLEMKLLIAQILCSFYVEPVIQLRDVKFLLQFTLSTKMPLLIKFKKINTN